MERLSRDSPHAKRLTVVKAWLTAAMIGVVACAALASAVQSETMSHYGSHIIGEWSPAAAAPCSKVWSRLRQGQVQVELREEEASHMLGTRRGAQPFLDAIRVDMRGVVCFLAGPATGVDLGCCCCGGVGGGDGGPAAFSPSYFEADMTRIWSHPRPRCGCILDAWMMSARRGDRSGFAGMGAFALSIKDLGTSSVPSDRCKSGAEGRGMLMARIVLGLPLSRILPPLSICTS